MSDSGYGEKGNRAGAYKSPIVKALWERRSAQRELEQAAVSPPVDRKPSDSRLTVDYDFTTNDFLRLGYQNPWGFLRKGRLFEDLDALAGNIAFNHCQRDNRVPLLVTASVDRIRVSNNPRVSDGDMEMSGQVIWVGKSSMVIAMSMRTKPSTEPWVHARFTFVARDQKSGKAVQINRLVPETGEEKAMFEEEEERDRWRKERRRLEREGKTPVGEDQVIDKDKVMRLLLQQAKPLMEMPCLADPTCVLIDTTRQSNATTMQLEHMNMLSRIFGGFLMRRAYEIAFSTAYLFGGSRPEFLEVAHIDFKLPVDVGDLVRFDSVVLYTKHDAGTPEVHVEVVASICRPEQVESKVSNTFNFTFRLPDKPTCRKVLPSNGDQARRMVDRIEQDIIADRLG